MMPERGPSNIGQLTSIAGLLCHLTGVPALPPHHRALEDDQSLPNGRSSVHWMYCSSTTYPRKTKPICTSVCTLCSARKQRIGIIMMKARQKELGEFSDDFSHFILEAWHTGHRAKHASQWKLQHILLNQNDDQRKRCHG